jgi:ribonucleoside-diphosphate reductase alpha chain
MLTPTHRESGPAPLRSSREATATSMRVRKRNGSTEPVDLNKIVRAVSRSCSGLADADAMRVATKTISGLYDSATTRELDQLSIQTAAALIVEEPAYAKLAARLLATYIDKEVRGQEIHAFSLSIAAGRRAGLIGDRLAAFVSSHARKLNDAVSPGRDVEFEYFGLRTLYDRYLLKHPQTRLALETPQHFFMRIACALSESVAEALELYQLLSSAGPCVWVRKCPAPGKTRLENGPFV